MIKTKISSFFISLVFCTSLFISFSASSASAADLALPLTIDSDTDTFQLSPVTYNGVTYYDYLLQHDLNSSFNTWSLYYFNLDETKTNARLEYNSSAIHATDTSYILNGLRLFFHPNQSYTVVSPAGSGGSLTVYSSGWTNFNSLTSLLSSSRDIYNTDGTLYYNSPLDTSGNNYDPFSGDIDFSLPSWQSGAGFVPVYPHPTYAPDSTLPIFSFSSTPYNVQLGLIVSPVPTSYHIKLYRSSTQLDDYTFTESGESTNGNLIFDFLQKDLFVNVDTLASNYVVEYYDSNDVKQASYYFATAQALSDTYTNQADITSLCDSVPHTMTGNMIGFAYDFDFHTDDICKLIIPPSNYFSSEFARISTSFTSAFPFLFQIKTAVSETAAIAHGTTVIAPASAEISVLGATTKTYDFSFLSSTMSQVRSALAVIFWLVFIRYIMQEVKEILGYHKSSQEQ